MTEVRTPIPLLVCVRVYNGFVISSIYKNKNNPQFKTW